MRKGILLAGGTGSRLYPLTNNINKHLLPIYNKPMIYYSLSVLMLAGIREIFIISTKEGLPKFKKLFGDGSRLGVSISYGQQNAPNGIAEALLIAEKFIDGTSVALILGDNIFFGAGLGSRLQKIHDGQNATIFCHEVKDPHRYGVVNLRKNGTIENIVEKPANPKSNYAVTGLYFYPNDAPKLARKLKPSDRGELEITDLNNLYLEQGRLNLENLSRGFSWHDAGTESALLDASNFVAAIESRQRLWIGCIEEIAWIMGWIEKEQIKEYLGKIKNSSYGKYLQSLISEIQ
ncbi:MAG: glucose-1-phosphate thymidylyltransferase [Rhodospirillaceae bacterium TMED167]|nr:glucose-1-phosphate thymidylyltransferase [Rhodospirillaceae bacterium]OUW23571.1 MAG: glucose-1-phosphate thymidylyltransferase [Rhodospirillaceae bacterium TMED167]